MVSTLQYEVLTMMLNELIFILLFLAAVISLLTCGVLALRRRFDRARRILLRLGAGAASYMLVVIAVSLVLPRRSVAIGADQCFDDWCIAVAGFSQAPEAQQTKYDVDLKLSSRARRIAQRENNLAVYLTDDQGHRVEAAADSSTAPLNVLLKPQESVIVRRSFLVPAGSTGVAAVITHEGGFPIGWFIIGYDTWFRKPPFIRLQK